MIADTEAASPEWRRVDLAVVWITAIVVVVGYCYVSWPGPATKLLLISVSLLLPPFAVYPLAWGGRLDQERTLRFGMYCSVPMAPLVLFGAWAESRGEGSPKGAIAMCALAIGYLVVWRLLRVSLDDLRTSTPWLTAGLGFLAGVWTDMPYMRWNALAFTLFGLSCGAALDKMRRSGSGDPGPLVVEPRQ